jgi:hypothetical protein
MSRPALDGPIVIYTGTLSRTVGTPLPNIGGRISGGTIIKVNRTTMNEILHTLLNKNSIASMRKLVRKRRGRGHSARGKTG